MQNTSRPRQTIGLWKALCAIAIVGSTAAGAGWLVGRTLLEDELKQYRQAETWKVPEAIRQIKDLSSELTQKLQAVRDLDELRAFKASATQKLNEKAIELDQTRAKYEAQMTSLRNDLSLVRTKLLEVETRLMDLQGEIVYISIGEAKPIGHKSLKVGVKDINPIFGSAEVYSGGFEKNSMQVGQSFTRKIEGKEYIVTLVKMEGKRCGFSFDVPK